MRRFAEFLVYVLGSAIVALVVGLFVAGVGSSGVALLELTHSFFWASFVVGVLGAVLLTALSDFSVRYVVLAGVSTSLLLGGLLYSTNVYLTKKKAEIDASNHPPHIINAVSPPPQVPIIKTQHPKPSAVSVKIEQHGTGNGAVGGDIRADPCSNVIVGGVNNQATVNCGTPQRILSKAEHNAFVKELKSADSVPITVACYVKDSEGCKYAQSFFDAFKDAQWDCGGMVEIRFDNPSDSVVRIGLKNRDAVPVGLHELSQAFKAINLKPHGLIEKDAKGDLELVVGMSRP